MCFDVSKRVDSNSVREANAFKQVIGMTSRSIIQNYKMSSISSTQDNSEAKSQSDALSNPTVLNSSSNMRNRPMNSLQLKETCEQRQLINYQKHLQHWDRYEKQIQLHFEQKGIVKAGGTENY